jgi:sporulation protein YlmC with PRC-barrel domain
MSKVSLTLAAALAVAPMGAPVLQPVQAQTVDLVVVDVKAVALGYRMSKLTGSSVVNDKGDKIGTMDDFIIGRDEPRVLYAVLQVGGFLGLGKHLVVVPSETLVVDPSGKITLPGASKDELKRLPEFAYAGG